jgi:hypothetical protein
MVRTVVLLVLLSPAVGCFWGYHDRRDVYVAPRHDEHRVERREEHRDHHDEHKDDHHHD